MMIENRAIKYYCPLLREIISRNLCYEINVEACDMFHSQTICSVILRTGLKKKMINEFCSKCKRYQLDTEYNKN